MNDAYCKLHIKFELVYLTKLFIYQHCQGYYIRLYYITHIFVSSFGDIFMVSFALLDR